MSLVVGQFVMIKYIQNNHWQENIMTLWHYFVFYKLTKRCMELELSNHSFYDNTIVVDEFDCPWVVIIADK